MTDIATISNFDGIAEPAVINKKPPLWGSARLTYTICAFLAMVVQLLLRNTLNFVILCMVKPHQVIANTTAAYADFDEDSRCGPMDSGTGSAIERSGNLLWSRKQEFELLGAFYYGYVVILPIAGHLADKFGGKLLFVHSLTLQSLVFMLIPYFAHKSFYGAVIVRIIQGLISGSGNPALYQLFSVWAHPNERTSFMSFAYGGFSVGALLAFPISSFLCKFAWELAFYVVGAVALIFGICCQWLVYNTLEDHPRLTKDEYKYLKANVVERSIVGKPWKSILTYVPVYAFILTHIFHTYGIMVLTLLIPRFFKEAMRLPLNWVGIISSAPFMGAFISKAVTIISCSTIERRPNLNLTRFRRITYVICNCSTIAFLFGIILCSCYQYVLVIILTICIGISTDMAFSGVYWPSLMYMAPAFTGLISGLANCLGTVSGFLAPLGISAIVVHGTKSEWNLVLATLMASYLLGAIVFGLFGSSKLAPWCNSSNLNKKNDNPNNENVEETKF